MTLKNILAFSSISIPYLRRRGGKERERGRERKGRRQGGRSGGDREEGAEETGREGERERRESTHMHKHQHTQTATCIFQKEIRVHVLYNTIIHNLTDPVT